MKNAAKYQIVNTFILKIIVILTMTFDHIGAFLQAYFQNAQNLSNLIIAFRSIGRLTLPLIALLVAEAMRYTHDREHYLSRIGLMAIAVLLFEVILQYGFGKPINDGNIFLTIIAGASFIYFIEDKNKKYLASLPLILILFSFISDILNLSWYPPYLRAQYSMYAFILIIGFYFTYYISDERAKALTGRDDIENLRKEGYYRSFTNLIWIGILVITTLLFWVVFRNGDYNILYMNPIQTWAILDIIFIFLYNGSKGYSNKIFQYGCYFYYPLHLLIIFLGFYLAMGMPSIGW